MNICSDGHEEICYDDRIHRHCPICEELKEKQEEIDDLKREKDGLDTEIENMQVKESALERELETCKDAYNNKG